MQRRLREIGRLRIGEQVATSSGKTRPAKLDKWRFTSRDEVAIKSVAGLYGGTPQPWEGAPVGEQFELYSDSKILDVIVPPVDLAMTQWYEAWSGGGCTRRCDGQTNVLTDTPCDCDLDERTCKPTTRLGVMLDGLDSIGIWRLEVHGYNGAVELLGSIEVVRALQQRGMTMVPARLILEPRQSKRDGQTLNFNVPVLDPKSPVSALLGGTPAQLAPAPAQLTASVTPIPRDDTPLPSVAEQIRAVDTPTVPARRANAAAALPATGIRPRPAAAIPAAAEPTTGTAPVHAIRESAPTTATATPQPTRAEATRASATERPERTPGGASQPAIRRLFAIMNGSAIVPKSTDKRTERAKRLEWASTVLGHEVATFDDLTAREVSTLSDLAEGKDPAPARSRPARSDEPPPRDEPQYDDGEEPF